MIKKIAITIFTSLIFNFMQAQQKIGFFNGIGYDLRLDTYESSLSKCFIKNSNYESTVLIPKGKMSYFIFNNDINDCNNTVLFRLKKNDQIESSSFLGYNPNATNILNRIEYKLVAKNTFLYPSISGYQLADIILSIGQSGF